MVGLSRILNRKIQDWSSSLGTYGNGGAGFFGVLLGSTNDFPDEWLVLTIWASGEWLLFDGRNVEGMALIKAKGSRMPLYAGSSNVTRGWDNLTEKLVGCTITEAEIADNYCKFHLQKDGLHHCLEVPADPERLPVYNGSGKKRSWNLSESLWDAWCISLSEIIPLSPQG